MVRITFVLSGGVRHEYRGSVRGRDGPLADGDEFVPFVRLSDGEREVVIGDMICGFFMKEAALVPEREYTFEVTGGGVDGSHRIFRVIDGETVVYEASRRDAAE